MGKVTLPPSGINDRLFEYCVLADGSDPLELEFKDAGYIARSVDNDFTPDIPTGFQPAGTDIKGMKPLVANGDVYVGYFDTTAKKLYLILIKIRPHCP
jgi:hypothetical protein